MITKLYDLIDKSNLTLVGYTYKDERIKDRFLSSLNPQKMPDLDADFSLSSYIRDIKLNELIGSVYNSKYLLLDIGNISIPKTGDALVSITKAKMIREISEDLRFESVKSGYRIIITAPLHRTTNQQDIYNFSGGSGPMHTADLAFRFVDGTINILKNRSDRSGGFDIPYHKI